MSGEEKWLDYLDSSYEVPPPSMCDATLISERDRVLFECDLRRGHDGPHTDKGCRWTTLPPTAPVPDPEAIDRAARDGHRERAGMSGEEKWWIVSFHDGSTEKRWGRLRIHENVLFIEVRSNCGGDVQDQHAYPLTSLRKWERSP